MGSAALYQLARRGAKVLGLDRHSPPHSKGSTHGGTRITRLANGEGFAYTPLAMRSYELWRELEKEAGVELLTLTGGLLMASRSGRSNYHGSADFVGQSVAAARAFGIEHDFMEADEI